MPSSFLVSPPPPRSPTLSVFLPTAFRGRHSHSCLTIRPNISARPRCPTSEPITGGATYRRLSTIAREMVFNFEGRHRPHVEGFASPLQRRTRREGSARPRCRGPFLIAREHAFDSVVGHHRPHMECSVGPLQRRDPSTTSLAARTLIAGLRTWMSLGSYHVCTSVSAPVCVWTSPSLSMEISRCILRSSYILPSNALQRLLRPRDDIAACAATALATEICFHSSRWRDVVWPASLYVHIYQIHFSPLFCCFSLLSSGWAEGWNELGDAGLPKCPTSGVNSPCLHDLWRDGVRWELICSPRILLLRSFSIS